VSELRDAIKEYFRTNASKGGRARDAKLSPRRKREIAKKAAKARWRKHNGT
jgi:glutathione synthase/RimK-type ligase-like ATP-grasp enzyme